MVTRITNQIFLGSAKQILGIIENNARRDNYDEIAVIGESFYMVQDLRPEMKNVFYLDAEMTFNKDGSYVISKPVS